MCGVHRRNACSEPFQPLCGQKRPEKREWSRKADEIVLNAMEHFTNRVMKLQDVGGVPSPEGFQEKKRETDTNSQNCSTEFQSSEAGSQPGFL